MKELLLLIDKLEKRKTSFEKNYERVTMKELAKSRAMMRSKDDI
jgi:hypothetical protein